MPDRNRSAVIMDLTSINYPNARLHVVTHTTTGAEPKTRPGVSFDIRTEGPPCILPDGTDGWFRVPFGVIDRDQLRILRNALTEFLLDFPEEEA